MKLFPATFRYLMKRQVILVAGSVVAIAIIVASCSAILVNLREQSLKNVENELARRSLMLAEQANLSFQALSLVTSSALEYVAHEGIDTEEEFRTQLGTESVHRMLKDRVTGDAQILAFAFFDSDGNLINTSRSWPAPPFSVADGEYFKSLRTGSADGRSVSSPYISLPGPRSISVGRAVFSRDGRRIGYLNGVISLPYFERYWQSVIGGENDSSISLVRLDGTLLARFPNSDTIGNRVAGGLADRFSGKPSLVIRTAGSINGQGRIEAAHMLDRLPLFIVTTETEENALRDWVRTAQMTAAIAACCVIVVLMTAFGLWCRSEDQARRIRMEAEKQELEKARLIAETELRSSRVAELQGHRLLAAVENMTQGLVMYDADERLVIVNDQYLRMYGLSSNVVRPGSRFVDVLRHRAGLFQLHQPPESYRVRILAEMADGRTTQEFVEMDDGREISVVNRPLPGGGWVGTHEDVTIVRAHEAALQAALAESQGTRLQLDAAINNMSQGLIMYDADERVILVNVRYLEMYGLPADIVKPGVTMHDIVVYRASVGDIKEPDKFCDTVRTNRKHGGYTTIQKQSDNRVFSIVNCALAGGGWVVTHEDVTALKNNEVALENALVESRETQLRLDAALNNMTQGLIMCDAEQRVAVVNDKYIEMYGLSRDVVKAGCTFQELIEHRAAAGHLSDEPKVYAAQLLDRFARDKYFDMTAVTTEGREILIHNRPAHGNGWLATHEDVSDQRLAARKLEETRRFLDTVIEYAPVAIVVKDARTRRVALVNRAYEDLIGKDRSEMVGKLPDEIYSPIMAPIIARRDEEKINAEAVRTNGESWIEKPDGSIRSVSTTSFVVRDNDGEPLYLIIVIEDITERKRAEARIAHMAHHDALTNLPNRALMSERLNDLLARMSAESPLAMLYLDLDHFKRVNDTLGHILCNELLKVVADRLRASVGPQDIVARLSGDEFMIVRTGLKTAKDAVAFAGSVREAVAAPVNLDGNQIFTDVSIGIAMAPEHGADTPQLLKCADMALYAAKSDGRGTHRFFEPAMSMRMNERRALELDLRKAIENGDLELYYQPLVTLGSDEIGGFEALLRWNHPERGQIPPAEFIPVAEDTGLIATIGDWALRTACFEAAGWPNQAKVAVNVSPVQFKNTKLAYTVAGILSASGLPPHRLEIEITEAVLMDESETTLQTLHRLHDLGVRIAMDDFGTGYSSLSYLRSFPFDKIKIDRSFIKDLGENEDSIAIVRSIASLANSLKMITTAEGVETAAQLEWVRALGCTEVQGYLFGRPKRSADLADYFHTGKAKPDTRSAA